MSNRIGQQLGNYRLIRLLGCGGFADVYLGEHLYLKNHAALKVLRTSLADEEVDQFLIEAQNLARLSHPQIVRVFDFAVEHGTPFLVMDYAPRGTMRMLHPHGSCLPLETTVAYVKQMGRALQFAHNHQEIHRDVKPENMLLGTQRQVMLSDFGLALFTPLSEQLSTQEMAGTVPYMAPEQIRGKPEFASDQYSLGIVAYEWLCGVRPFEGAPWQIAYQQISLPPPRLREHDSSLPAAVEAVVLKALTKDPRERYVSVQLFSQALERASYVTRTKFQIDIQATIPIVSVPPTHTVPSKRVFLSASQDDQVFVARLTSDLQRRRVAVWHETPKGTMNAPDREDAVRLAIRAVDVVLLVVSPHTRSSRVIREHLRIASMYQRRLVFVWAAGKDIVTALPDEWGKTVQVDLFDARLTHYEHVIDELVACIEEKSSAVEPSLPEPSFEPRNPYKGLCAFTQNDAADFFGRDSLLDELTDKMKGMLKLGQPGMPTARMLTVIGPSGSGKSSAVMAGLLPCLQRGALPTSQKWVYLKPMVPGIHPFESLALTLAARFPKRSVKALREYLENDAARGLHLLTTQLVKTPGQRVVLFIDQFEELFTQIIDEAERQRFIDVLVTAVTEPHGSVIVILTLRADFYDRPMSYLELHRLIAAHQVSALPMEIHDLRAAIKHPAALPDVQLTFEGNLVGDLLFEVQGQVGALPLLQFTLDQLFQRRADHTLTLAAYHEIGGVKGALAKQAESTFTALPSEEHSMLARSLFLRLIDPGMTEQDTTRRRAALAEISLPDAKQTTIIREVADAFVAARLLTTNKFAGITTVEVSHEALIREWPRLADWLREGRQDIRLQQAVGEDAAEWEQHDQPRDRLYRGSQLKEARNWARRNIPSTREVAFLSACTAQRMRYLVSVIALALLLISTVGITGWNYVHQPPDLTHVTNLNNNGPGSLRWAIDTSPSGSMITFDARQSGTIMLMSGDLNITKNLTISGPMARTLAVSSGKSGYSIHVLRGSSVTISNLTFKDSKTAAGIILNDGTLTLSNSTVSGNSASGPLIARGGIFNGGALNRGGGIFNDGTLTLSNSTVSGNSALNDGGGIYNVGMLALIDSTISDNTAGREGGGIFNVGASFPHGALQKVGMLTLTNSMVSNNKSGVISIGSSS